MRNGLPSRFWQNKSMCSKAHQRRWKRTAQEGCPSAISLHLSQQMWEESQDPAFQILNSSCSFTCMTAMCSSSLGPCQVSDTSCQEHAVFGSQQKKANSQKVDKNIHLSQYGMLREVLLETVTANFLKSGKGNKDTKCYCMLLLSLSWTKLI